MAKILLNVELDKTNLKQVEKQIDGLFNPKSSGSSNNGTKSASANIDNLRKSYANLLTTIQGAEKYYKKGTFSAISASAKKFQADLIALKSTQGNYTTEVQRLEAELRRLQREFAETRESSKNMHGSFLEIVKGFAKFQLSAMLVMKPLQLIRGAWADINETLVETEDRIVELNRVTNNMANADALYKLAQQYGQTFENVSEITLNFARNGMDWAESLQATESALLAINVAELDATQASEGMIAIMQQFGYEASQLELIVDKLNITSDNAAVTTEKLLTALQRTGSSAKNANLTLEQTVGIITALSEATGRSGENLGTAVNSLIQFSTKSSALETFEKLGGGVAKAVEDYRMGAGTVLDIWKELSTVIKDTGTQNENILGGLFADDDWRSLNEELQETLGANFATVTEIYGTASTFRKNYFIALLNNLDQVQETIDTMDETQGYSQKENEKYLDTYTAKVNKLKATWKEMANDPQGLLAIKKFFVDMARVLLTALDYIGGLRTVFVGLAIGTLPLMVGLLKKAVIAMRQLAVGGKALQSAFGWLGLIGSIGSAVAGLLQSIDKIGKRKEEKAKEERQEAISSWESIKEEVLQLSQLGAKFDELYGIKNKTIEQENEYQEIQKQIVDQLGDRAIALKRLTEGTDEYAEELKKLTDEERKRQMLQAQSSANAYLAETNIKVHEHYTTSTNTIQRLSNYDFEHLSGRMSTANLIKAYEEKIEALYWSGIPDKEEYDDYVNYTKSLRESYEKWIETQSTADSLEAVLTGKLSTEEDFNNLISDIIEKTQANESYRSLIEGVVLKTTGYKTPEQPTSTVGKTNAEIVETLKAIRDNTQKTQEIEEKMLALEEAKNQRTVRVYNAETGQWEMQANQTAIDTAEKNLREHALDVVIEALGENGKLPEGFEIPDWLSNIMSPTSQESFDDFFASMGILAGIYNKTPSSGGVVSNSNTSNTTNNNQSYILNGVSIPKEIADKYHLPELFEAMMIE